MTEKFKNKLTIREPEGGLSCSYLASWLLRASSFSCPYGMTQNIRMWPKTDWKEDLKEGSRFPATFKMRKPHNVQSNHIKKSYLKTYYLLIPDRCLSKTHYPNRMGINYVYFYLLINQRQYFIVVADSLCQPSVPGNSFFNEHYLICSPIAFYKTAELE